MNNVTPESKLKILNTLAIFGLIGIIFLIAWLSVQIVNLFPSAINSLASIADSVYNSDPLKEISVEKNIVINSTDDKIKSGENFVITWNNDATSGQYVFKHTCVEGVAVSIESDTNKFTSTTCGETYNIGLVDKAVLIINSEKKAEVNLDYTISYFKNNGLTESSSTTKTVIIENPRFEDKPDTVATTTQGEVTKPDNKPTTTYDYTYKIPVSNPNGFTDLEVTYLGIGKRNSSGIFTNTGILDKDLSGAFQFSVKNIGTKTSEKWSFSANLPGDLSYESKDQTPLKPNERSIITLGFPAVNTTELQKFGVTIDIKNDKNLKNNNFSWTVKAK